jgi:hypothetical protein
MNTHRLAVRVYASVLLSFALCASHVQADPVITLFDTGGTPGQVDSHYTITASPLGPMAVHVTTGSPDVYPFNTWEDNDSESQWISPQASYAPGTGNVAGAWTFQTTFSLAGFNKTTVNFTDANFWVSSEMISISLNGVAIDLPSMGDPFGPTTFIDALQAVANGGAGLLDGVNTLTFVVNNTGTGTTPTGLRVEIAADATPIPEPSTFFLLGLTGAAILARRRGCFLHR